MEAMADTNKTLPLLEIVCDNCNGKGGWVDDRPNGVGMWHCSECHGAGYLPTEAGKAIYAMISHNFRRIMHETEL